MPDATDLLDEVTALARRHRELGEVIADLAAQRDELKARFEGLVCVGYEVEVDGKPVFKRSPNRAYSPDLAVKIAHAEAIPVTRETVVDHADLKARLTAAGHISRAMVAGSGNNRVQL